MFWKREKHGVFLSTEASSKTKMGFVDRQARCELLIFVSLPFTTKVRQGFLIIFREQEHIGFISSTAYDKLQRPIVFVFIITYSSFGSSKQIAVPFINSWGHSIKL